MSKILVLYYSMYGHTNVLAKAVGEGAQSIEGASVSIKRVPELMSEEIAKQAGAQVNNDHEIATPNELADYDAIIIGTPTRFGNMCAQMRNFLDQTGGLWAKGALDGKVGSAFTCSGTGSGNETTIMTVMNTFIHHGMTVIGISPKAAELGDLSHMRGGSIYGAGSITGMGETARMPSDCELGIAKGQGARVAALAKQISG